MKNPPHTYIQKLRGFLDPAVTRKVGNRVAYGRTGSQEVAGSYNNHRINGLIPGSSGHWSNAFGSLVSLFSCIPANGGLMADGRTRLLAI